MILLMTMLLGCFAVVSHGYASKLSVPSHTHHGNDAGTIGLVRTRLRGHAHQDNLSSRRLDETPSVAATTFACAEIRAEPFHAKLELEYQYLIEFSGNGPHTLWDIQNAIQHAVISALSSCDELDRPNYAVAFVPAHMISNQGTKTAILVGHDRVIVSFSRYNGDIQWCDVGDSSCL